MVNENGPEWVASPPGPGSGNTMSKDIRGNGKRQEVLWSAADLPELDRLLSDPTFILPELDGQQAARTPLRRFLPTVALLPPDRRVEAVTAFLAGRDRRFRKQLADDLKELDAASAASAACAPEPREPACLADFENDFIGDQWLVPLWIPKGLVCALSGFEKVGKTILALDWCWRIYHAEPWFDGSPPSFDPGTPTLWVPADRHWRNLMGRAKKIGLPADALFFNTYKEDRYGGTTLDDKEDRERLEELILLKKPGLVFVDSLSNATTEDITRTDDISELLGAIADISAKTETTIVFLPHLNLQGGILGRRSKGMFRTIMKLSCPNPEEYHKQILILDESFEKRPECGYHITTADDTTFYESTKDKPFVTTPIKEGRAGVGGAPSDKRDNTKLLILFTLAGAPNQELFRKDLLKQLQKAIPNPDPKTNPQITEPTLIRAIEALEAQNKVITSLVNNKILVRLVPQPTPEQIEEDFASQLRDTPEEVPTSKDPDE